MSHLFSKCLLLEDHKVYCKSLCEYLVKWKIVNEAIPCFDYYDALVKINEYNYPLVILDIEIKDGNKDGFDLAQKVKVKYPETRIVMFSNYDDSVYIKKFYSLGLNAYLLKGCDEEKFRDVLSKIKDGTKYIDVQIQDKWNRIKSESDFQSSILFERNISKKEAEIISKLCEDKHVDEIANELNISSPTLKKHISNLSKKLHNKTRVGIVNFAILCGLYKK